MSVVYFPVCRRLEQALVGPDQVAEGLYWYGCRGFKTREAWLESMSDRDYRRVREWETRNMAWLASQDDGDKQQGGAA